MLYVIMSVYNGDKTPHVKVAIDSILQQTYREFELFIKCDGPISDSLMNYLDSISDARFHLRKREENKGLAITLNELLEEVVGHNDCTYIARMDADDYALSHRFSTQVAYMERHQNVDVVGSYIMESANPSQFEGNVVRYPTTHKACKAIFGRRNPVAHPSVMFRYSYIKKAGLYPTSTLRDEDTLYWLKGFLAGCQFANIPEVLTNMRVLDSFYNRRNSSDKVKGDLDNRLRVIRELELPAVNRLYAYLRYYLFRYASPTILKWAYKLRG